MTTEDIKKYCHQKDPDAFLDSITKSGLIYEAYIGAPHVFFRIPLKELGNGTFYRTMKAKHLLKYLIKKL